ncbi:MAG TPA: PqqD family protein [Gemmatimonadaceae bacterium]|nr:PqqD family protein [Gemmatimonadaceae bacterium]
MSRYSVSPDAAFATLDDGAVILNLRTKRYYSLNETGAAVWGMLEAGTTTAHSLVARLVELYDVTDAQARREVDRLLGELEAESLITPHRE